MYKTEHQTSLCVSVYFTKDDGTFPRLIGHIFNKAPGVFTAERGPYSLGEFESNKAAKAAIIHEFERPLNMQQCHEWNTSTGIYA